MGVLLMAGFVGLSTSDRILTSFVPAREPEDTLWGPGGRYARHGRNCPGVVVPTWIAMAIPSSRSPSMARLSFSARCHDIDHTRRLAERCGGDEQQLQHIAQPPDIVIAAPSQPPAA